jgi:hypothetical protein
MVTLISSIISLGLPTGASIIFNALVDIVAKRSPVIATLELIILELGAKPTMSPIEKFLVEGLSFVLAAGIDVPTSKSFVLGVPKGYDCAIAMCYVFFVTLLVFGLYVADAEVSSALSKALSFAVMRFLDSPLAVSDPSAAMSPRFFNNAIAKPLSLT